jgi:hypothetical protein
MRIKVQHLNEQFQSTIEFSCASCGQKGSVCWEGEGASQIPRRLVQLSHGFHAESGRVRSNEPLIVCDACDQFHHG